MTVRDEQPRTLTLGALLTVQGLTAEAATPVINYTFVSARSSSTSIAPLLFPVD